DKLTARQLLYALLLPSGADAAYTLAKAYGPGLSRFVTRMNATARLLGMRRTHFSNFDGLPYPTPYSNYSTASNLLVLGRAAMRLPVFRSVVAKRSYWLAAGSGHRAYRWKNLNPLLGHYPGAIGIKPGYTGAAGQCLLFEATRNGHAVIGVTLHSPGSISSVNPADATRILNWALSHLSYPEDWPPAARRRLPARRTPPAACRTPPAERRPPPAERSETGFPLRQDALDPGFHCVPADPAHPDRWQESLGIR